MSNTNNTSNSAKRSSVHAAGEAPKMPTIDFRTIIEFPEMDLEDYLQLATSFSLANQIFLIGLRKYVEGNCEIPECLDAYIDFSNDIQQRVTNILKEKLTSEVIAMLAD